jgi:hypothetical protein
MRLWRTLALLCCALFLALVARFYHPGLGFSALLMIPEGDAEYQVPALRDLPHYRYPEGHAYDGAMYVQIAMTPLLGDPAIDRALDAPAYRVRRILFCWTAYALGLGRPAWIMQAYALQNVVCWLILAWFITRWFPLRSARFFALWAASMFSHGLLTSARLSVLDGPSLLLLAFAAAAAERNRTWLTSGILGIAALGRETNLLGAVMLPWPRGWRGWLRAAGACVVVVLPLLVWQDYVWSIYRGTSASEGAGQITIPLSGYLTKWVSTLQNVRTIDVHLTAGQLLVLVSITAQTAYIAWTRKGSEPWWKLAAAFAVLMMCVDWAVWEGYPGAITRVTLPLKFGVNVLLARDESRGFWAWLVLGNLDVAFSQYIFTT